LRGRVQDRNEAGLRTRRFAARIKAIEDGDFGTGTHDRSQPLDLAQPSDEKTAAARIKKGGRDRIDTQTISVSLDDRPAFCRRDAP